MGQIVRTKKKKGRPSKADLAARRSAAAAGEAAENELRRSGRRRNVRYTFDIDYFLDEEYLLEDDDEDDSRRREKKLELLLKLQGKDNDGEDELTPSRTRRVSHAPASSPSSSSSSSSSDGRPSKKRKVHGDDEEYEENDDDNEIDEVRGRKAESRGVESSPGTPSERPSRIPLPDKKTLELILDKLQKKDIYGVYAEPVDPEELPDYHDVIENPMDFATVRNKLRNGSYATLELFESDVFLICSNAMQYNAPDTIYHKQARTIQELATKKFQKLRVNAERIEHSEKEVKSDQKPKSSVVKKLIKKPIGRTVQEPVGSDFSSGATLANAGDIQSGSNACPGTSGRPGSIDELIEGNSFLTDNNLDREELHSGKGPLCRFGRKSALQDEDRRATFDISAQSDSSSESVFSTFEGESKHLIPVGLYADNSYARSLARFAATLGPIAWEYASRRIEQALPPGFKFGRGWIGEYEPLPTPVLMLKNYTLKEPSFLAKFRQKIDVAKDKIKPKKNPVSFKDNPIARPTVEGKRQSAGSTGSKPTANNTNVSNTTKVQHNCDPTIESKPFFLGASGKKPPNSASPKHHAQNFHSQNFIESEKKLLKQAELNSQPLPTNQISAGQSKATNSIVVPSPKSVKMAPNNRNPLSSACSEQLNINGFSAGKLPNNGFDSNGGVGLSAGGFANNGNKAVTLFPHGQELSDPVHMMWMLSEKSQNQQKSSQHSRVDVSPVPPATQSMRRGDDSNNAAAAAARAWMSIGAGGFKQASDNTGTKNSQISAESLYNPARDHHEQNLQYRGEFPGMHFQAGKGTFPFNTFAAPHMARAGIEAQKPNGPMIFPQLVAADLSRFQMPSPRQNLNTPAQPRPKQESLPPDLNISFQSSGSPGTPGRPSSGVLVDSQQPDLALQL